MSYNIKSIKQEFKNKGIFYTPPELAILLKSYVNFDPTSVYDPTCGDGSLLSVFGDNVRKYGQEINQTQIDVCNKRLINFTGYCGDTLKDPAFKEIKFDCIMANPPFSIKWDQTIDERFEKSPDIPPPSKADYAFILHILHYLSDKGIAVVLCFPGILYRGSREAKIRKWLVDNNLIDRVVSIPGDTFVDTKIGTSILVIKKNKKTTDIIFEDKKLGIEKYISLEQIKQNDYNLSVNSFIYETIEKEIIDPIELELICRKKMIKKLKNDIEQSIMVAEFENIDVSIYLDDIYNVISEYRNKINNKILKNY